MEQMRHDKIIGSSLDAEVDIYCDDNTYKLLEKLGDELMIIHIYAKAFIMHIFFLRHRP
jgi:isoleucyl-tRNA synthetase